jgi:Putative Flp pilus-assembly TadE/G-like
MGIRRIRRAAAATRGQHRRPRRGLRRAQDGFVLPLTAIMIVTLTAMAGYGADLGSWYARTAQLQRAADAAALAGVVWMPNDLVSATTYATAAAARNDVTIDAAKGTSIAILTVPGSANRLKVCVTDTLVEAYFTKMYRQFHTITKCATAEYILPVALGSPENVYGTGNQLVPAENIWGAVNGYCTPAEQGDLKLSRWTQTYNGATWDCPGTTTNAYYDPKGYTYIFDIPVGHGNTSLQVFDPSWNPGGGIDPGGTGTFDTTYTLYSADNTPLDPTDNPIIGAPQVFPTNDAASSGAWVTLYTVTAGDPSGRYRLEVKTDPADDGQGANLFGLRALRASGPARCSTITDTTCPGVFAESYMSIFANFPSGVATPYLASVPASHAGKTMVITMFDPGEGGQTIEVIAPDGSSWPFTYRTIYPTLNEYSGSGTSIDVSGTPGALPGRLSASKFNERLIEITVGLPEAYTTYFGTQTWWRIKYTFGANVTDRSTWSVQILGDPVHLIE